MVIQPNIALASWIGNFSSPTETVGKGANQVGELQEAHEHIGADEEHKRAQTAHPACPDEACQGGQGRAKKLHHGNHNHGSTW